ncbi:class I SAM-dependent methyltransferase [Limnohabitans sp. Jir72]|uniref:class I SAM-dependent methyltransferase n=1 Tax=Limnohabitans sp. Jir72 TaxID=1977909 RepID=UPI0018EEA28C|nr:class I SAM-dependent methyltransferase [Limnohabitans sp. Jir72]
MKSLDLGCGAYPKNPFDADFLYGVDIRDDIDKNVKKSDLVTEALPFDDNYFDFVTAFDVIEHIPRIIYAPNRIYPFVNLMNEIYRVLKNGGKFLSHTPAYPYAEAFRDPTHVNIITNETFPLYFDDQNRLANMYGFNGSFRIESQQWYGPHLISILVKN